MYESQWTDCTLEIPYKQRSISLHRVVSKALLDCTIGNKFQSILQVDESHTRMAPLR